MIIAKTYTLTHSGISYSRTFTINLVILSLVVSCVMLIVGSNIARAFTLVGALSIVRFRNAIKDTIDIGFIFFSMAVGMACGTRFYLMGVTMTLCISTIIFILNKTNFGERNVSQSLLKIMTNEKDGADTIISPLIKKVAFEHSLISINGVGGDNIELNYAVTFHHKNKEQLLVSTLRDVPIVKDVQIYLGDALSEI